MLILIVLSKIAFLAASSQARERSAWLNPSAKSNTRIQSTSAVSNPASLFFMIPSAVDLSGNAYSITSSKRRNNARSNKSG